MTATDWFLTNERPRWPTSIAGWLELARGVFLVDVLRRCSTSGCFRRRWGNVFLGSIPMCQEHYSAWYSDDPPPPPDWHPTRSREIL